VRVAIRVDAGLALGTGHVMRCLTLAEALRAEGAEVAFVCREHPGHLIEHLGTRAWPVYPLPAAEQVAGADADAPAHAAWLGADWRLDAEQTRAALADGAPWDWLVIDHYAIDWRWEQATASLAHARLVIDDLADRRHDCELLLDQNAVPGRDTLYAGLTPAGCRRLIGPEYALLRPEFAVARAGLTPRVGAVRKVQVFFGGVDADDLTSLAIEAVAGLGRADLSCEVIVGAANPRAQAITARCAELPCFSCHGPVDDMAARMVRADLSVGAGGGALLERCALGLPSIVLALADNQVPGCQALAEAGATLYLGRPDADTGARLGAALAVCLAAPEFLRHMAERARQVTDAQGTRRVVERLAVGTIILRQADVGDRANLLAWRNHETSRRYSGDGALIDAANHDAWFERVLADPDRLLLIGADAAGPVGVLRYDLAGPRAHISVYLVPGRQGRGLGTCLIEAGSAWLGACRPEVAEIHAEIHADNAASQRAFAKAGFDPVKCYYVKRLRGD
jgi:UDP-2,4-diacetamido-2,4,6-trideoxy-beta-L-altropyranose hydrolase